MVSKETRMLVTITPPQRSFNLVVGANLKPLDVTVAQCDAAHLSTGVRVTIDADLTQNHPATIEPAPNTTIVNRALKEFMRITRPYDTHYHGVYCHAHPKMNFGDSYAPYLHGDVVLVAALAVAGTNGATSVAIDGDRSYRESVGMPPREHSRVVATIIEGIRTYINEINWEKIESPVAAIIFAMGPEAYAAWEQNADKLSAYFLRHTAEHRTPRR